MIDKPLYQNPLGGGLGQIIPNPGAGNVPRGGAQDVDPIMQGFQDSEFRKNANMMQQDAVNFKYKGQDMMMNGSMSGAFKQYLDSIGKGDLYEGNLNFTPLPQPTEGVSQDVLGNPNLLAPLNPVPGHQPATPPILDGTRSVNPIVSGPEGIESTATAPIFTGNATLSDNTLNNFLGDGTTSANPYNRVGQQLTGPDQFGDLNSRLNKLEEGIGSLLNQNRGFDFNSMQPRYGAPNYGYSPFSMTGLGSLFGGYYG